MRLSEMAGKMVVNIEDGEVLGHIGDADLLINEVTGDIVSILMPVRSSMFNRFFEHSSITIEWSKVKKVGTEVIVVELGDEIKPLR